VARLSRGRGAGAQGRRDEGPTLYSSAYCPRYRFSYILPFLSPLPSFPFLISSYFFVFLVFSLFLISLLLALIAQSSSGSATRLIDNA
jgi:hypothetical protein